MISDPYDAYNNDAPPPPPPLRTLCPLSQTKKVGKIESSKNIQYSFTYTYLHLPFTFLSQKHIGLKRDFILAENKFNEHIVAELFKRSFLCKVK